MINTALHIARTLHTDSILNCVLREKIERLIAVLRRETGNPAISGMVPAQHREILRQLINDQPELEAVWTNRLDGSIVHSVPPAGLANARVRQWWQQAAAGNEYVSNVYISAITQKPCLTLSLPVRDPSGKIVGVLGADVML
jgi:hypothetical protein